jgi:3-phenylpropionate/trans-cinnamate dioxygenase ferredoxin subunit
VKLAPETGMGSFVEVGKTGEFEDGTMTKLLVQEHEILLARVGDKYYAADNRCPHLKGNLSAGRLEGTVVACPLQGSQFDLRDGKVIRWMKESISSPTVAKTRNPPKPLKIYNVKIEGDAVLIEI